MGVREDAITRVVSEAKANPKGGEAKANPKGGEAKALLEVLGPDEVPERAVKGFLGKRQWIARRHGSACDLR